MTMPIVFNSVNVNGQYTNATVSIGENVQTGWSGNSKNNFGSGPSFGANLFMYPYNVIMDSDLVDAPMSVPEYTPTIQSQQL